MHDHPILSQLALGYCPMFDRQRAVVGTRLTVFPLRRDAVPPAEPLLQLLAGVWPEAAAQVSLNVASEALLHGLLALPPLPNLMLEVPAFIAANPAHAPALQAFKERGGKLLVKGRPASELPPEVLPCFKHSIIDVGEERRGILVPFGVSRVLSHIQSGVRTMAELDASFGRGAAAVFGWPTEDPTPANSHGSVSPDLKVIVELINRVDREEPIERLDAVLKNDPTLAFRLIRYLNSPAFGLRVEIGSFQHAIMMLGYHKLKRWLALLLASASKDTNLRPLMYAAVRRGLMMEELARADGDQQTGGEMFICGVFSQLDRLMRQPFADLLKAIPVPERVFAALVDGTGPFQPFLDVVRAVEQPTLSDLRECAERAMLSVGDVNRALLRALAAAGHLD